MKKKLFILQKIKIRIYNNKYNPTAQRYTISLLFVSAFNNINLSNLFLSYSLKTRK